MYTNKMIRVLPFSILFVLSILLGKSDDEIGGLYFRSNYDRSNSSGKGTTLLLPEKGLIKYQDDLRLEFDIFFWRKNPFGFVLSAGNVDNPDAIVISYSEYRSRDTSFIELTYKDRPSVISIPILDKDQGWKQWKRLTLFLNSNDNRIGLSFDAQDISWYQATSPLPDDLQFRFGETSHNIEPPRMVLRDIRLYKDGHAFLYWPLDEIHGTQVSCESKNGLPKKGMMSNGVWMKEMHTAWRVTDQITLPLGGFQSIGFNDQDNEYIFSVGDSLYFINRSNIKIDQRFPFELLSNDDFRYFYHPVKDQVVSMHGGGGGPVASFDHDNNEWKDSDIRFESDDLFYQSSILFDHTDGSLFTLGGYGWYEQKDLLQKYNEDLRSWDVLSYDVIGKNAFLPRSKATISYDRDSDRYFIYGGGGNESGKQQQGFRWLNDLWVLDLKGLTIEQLWEDELDAIDNEEEFHHILVPKKKRLFRISLNGTGPVDGLSRGLFSTKFDKMEFIDTQIHLSLNENESEVIVYKDYLEETDELFLVTLGQGFNEQILRFRTISLPIIPHDKETYGIAKLLLIGLIALLCLGLFYGNLFPKKDGQGSIMMNDHYIPRNKEKIVLNKGITIHFLDNFRIWIDGEEIGYSNWRSKKARKLFLYILLKNSNGATITEINSLFWPDVKMDSARNSRSVALNKIRNTIKPYGDLIKKIDDRLVFINNDRVYFDYHELLISLKDDKLEDMYNPIRLFGKNGLLPEMDDEWIEFFRVDLLSMMANYAKKIAKRYIEKEDWIMVELIGNRMLLWNSFNDDGLYFSVLANKKMNKLGISHQIYEDFNNRYKEEMGESYPTSYDSIDLLIETNHHNI